DFLIRRLPDVCLLLYILAATLGAFTGGIWASFGIGGALILFLGTWAIEKRIPWPERQLGLFALVALAIFALETIKSPRPSYSWPEWERLLTIFLPLCLLSSAAVQKRAYSTQLFEILPIAALAGAMGLSAELLAGGP